MHTKCEERLSQKLIHLWRKQMREKKNRQIKEMISMRMLTFFYTIQHVIPNVCTKFQILGAVIPEKSLTKHFIGEKNGQLKGMISTRMLILSYTIQVGVPKVCSKFENTRCSSSWEIFDGKNSLYTQTDNHCYWKGKTVYPLYTPYSGGITNDLGKTEGLFCCLCTKYGIYCCGYN